MSNETRKDEAQNKTGIVEWRDQKFEVSREYADWTVDFLESLEEGKAVGIVRGALGQQQWRTVRGLNLKVSELNELSDLIAKAMGFGSSGESQTSSD